MFIKEREYLDKLETAIDKLDNIDYNKLTDVKSVVDDAKDDLTSIKDELKEEIEKFDTWADEESKKEPMIVTGLMSQGT